MDRRPTSGGVGEALSEHYVPRTHPQLTMRKKQLELGAVVAERKYDWRRGDDAGSLTVRIGSPQRDPLPGGDWLCPVQFSGAPTGCGISMGVRPVYGLDSLQALTLALGYVQSELARVEASLRLTWLNSSDIGLPDILGLIGVRRAFLRSPRRGVR